MRRSLYAGAAAFAVILITSHLRSTPYNNYVLLADAFLHGHVWINWPGDYIDALAYHGARYVIEAPLPAVLLMPMVAIFGTSANQTVVATLLGAIAIAAAWEICERLAVPTKHAIWLCAFLLAGTDLLWCAMLGDVWFIAHVCAACFTLLAIVELLGKKRGWLVALWALCAAESRFSMVLAIPVYVYLLTANFSEESVSADSLSAPRGRLISFAGVVAAGVVLWGLYNQARWGTLADIGYTLWYHQDQVGLPYGSPFKLQYLPYELHSFFIASPSFAAVAPYVIPSMEGIALTWTSPALVFAFFAQRPARLAIALWAAVVLTAAPNFLYYVNGFAQFGMRHALDFEPFLFVLMALAARRALPLWVKVLLAYSIVVGLWGCWYWNAIVRTKY